MLIENCILFAVACALAAGLTALMCWLAPRLDLLDRPDCHRKMHNKATPLGGGVAVFLATAITLALLRFLPGPFQERLSNFDKTLVAVLLGGFVIMLVGLFDDRFHLRGRQKLVGQVAAASILMIGGLLIKNITIFGWSISLGPRAIPFTLFWLLGAINALNLLDGSDGLAGTVGLILISAIAVMATMLGLTEVSIFAVVFAGSLLGFLRFNFPPAKIFLGDAGSMLIGLVVGALAILGSLKGPGTVLLAAPLSLWMIPICDSAAAILRRKLTGRSIYTTDRGHMHHRLLDRFGSNVTVLVWVGGACLVTSAGALIGIRQQNDAIAVLVCVSVVLVFLVTGIFGRAEFHLLTKFIHRTGSRMVSRGTSCDKQLVGRTFHLQGNQNWEAPWQSLLAMAQRLGVSRIRLDINCPVAREEYCASWSRPLQEERRRYEITVPIMASGQPVGNLTISGERNGDSVSNLLDPLVEMLDQAEMDFASLGNTDRFARIPAGGENGDIVVAQEQEPAVGGKYPK